MNPDPRIPIFMTAWLLRQAERGERVVRGLHRPVNLGERWPFFAVELDLDAHRTLEAALGHDVEHALEVDMAFPDRRKTPRWALAALVLEVAGDELRSPRGQIIARLSPAIEFDIGGIVIDEHVLAPDPL